MLYQFSERVSMEILLKSLGTRRLSVQMLVMNDYTTGQCDVG
jgi:hypothetical protein